jgi:hypothetical protein
MAELIRPSRWLFESHEVHPEKRTIAHDWLHFFESSVACSEEQA